MGEIASHTALPAPTATRVVDKLVDPGFASRRTDPVDRRRVLVHLAANGRAVIERVCGRVERKIGAALGSAHTPERAQLAELLEALARAPPAPPDLPLPETPRAPQLPTSASDISARRPLSGAMPPAPCRATRVPADRGRSRACDPRHQLPCPAVAASRSAIVTPCAGRSSTVTGSPADTAAGCSTAR